MGEQVFFLPGLFQDMLFAMDLTALYALANRAAYNAEPTMLRPAAAFRRQSAVYAAQDLSATTKNYLVGIFLQKFSCSPVRVYDVHVGVHHERGDGKGLKNVLEESFVVQQYHFRLRHETSPFNSMHLNLFYCITTSVQGEAY